MATFSSLCVSKNVITKIKKACLKQQVITRLLEIFNDNYPCDGVVLLWVYFPLLLLDVVNRGLELSEERKLNTFITDYIDSRFIIYKSASSDDEIDILLHGTPEQKRKLCRRGQGKGDKSSSEDEFEKEVNAELNVHVKALEKKRGSVSSVEAGPSNDTGAGVGEDEPQKYYDDVYFDSDEEEMFTGGDGKANNVKLSNDELLYDPGADDDDEKWVQNRRRSYQPNSQASSEKEKKKPLPNSDAVLDCPACMTTLCLDCQRHDSYKHQYRAMFVMNCTTDFNETLKYPRAKTKQKQKKKQKVSSVQEINSEADDKFHPVKCNECNTVVGVYDSEEIYHFFNVLASY